MKRESSEPSSKKGYALIPNNSSGSSFRNTIH
jgi:hypothetical protein